MSRAVKHTIALGGAREGRSPNGEDRRHGTSISLEPVYWEALRYIARGREISVAALVTEIDGTKEQRLSLAVREFVTQWFAARVGVLQSPPAQNPPCG